MAETPPARGGTRERILTVAISLFARKGYENTSLREIADAVGVTKAALYYHFKTKEEIVESAFVTYLAEVDDIINWAKTRKPTPENRAELVRRYNAVVRRGLLRAQFVTQERVSGGHLQPMKEFRERLGLLASFLIDLDEKLDSRVRKSLALHSLHFGWSVLREAYEESGVDVEDFSESLQRAAIGLLRDEPS